MSIKRLRVRSKIVKLNWANFCSVKNPFSLADFWRVGILRVFLIPSDSYIASAVRTYKKVIHVMELLAYQQNLLVFQCYIFLIWRHKKALSGRKKSGTLRYIQEFAKIPVQISVLLDKLHSFTISHIYVIFLRECCIRNIGTSSGFWSNLRKFKKFIRSFFIVKTSLIWIYNLEFFNISGTNPWNKFNCPRIVRNLGSLIIVIYYLLNNNLF